MKTLMEKVNLILGETDDRVDERKGDGDEYEKFMRKKMKEWGIKSPRELSRSERKKFFKEIENEWTKENPRTDDKDR